MILEDLDHSDDEKRFYCLGKVSGEIMTVRFTYRKNKIRIIGAGYWRKGEKIYDRDKERISLYVSEDTKTTWNDYIKENKYTLSKLIRESVDFFIKKKIESY